MRKLFKIILTSCKVIGNSYNNHIRQDDHTHTRIHDKIMFRKNIVQYHRNIVHHQRKIIRTSYTIIRQSYTQNGEARVNTFLKMRKPHQNIKIYKAFFKTQHKQLRKQFKHNLKM